MHYHALRLVDHEQIGILIQNVERDILRDDIRYHRLRIGDIDQIAFCNGRIGLDLFAVEQDCAVANHPLRLRAG